MNPLADDRAPGDATPPSPRLPAGRVGRPHGLDGSFYVTRPKPRLLTLAGEVFIAGESRVIVRRAGTEQRPIVRLEGVDDREGAEALRGAELSVERDAAPELEPGEWWAHELEGCAVLDGERLLGTVLRMLELPSCEALEVRPAGGGEPLLVPLVSDAIRSVEPAARRIEVDLEFLNLDAETSTAAARRAPERGGGA